MGLGGFLFCFILLLLLPNVNESRPHSFSLLRLYSLIFLHILLASYASAIFLKFLCSESVEKLQ